MPHHHYVPLAVSTTYPAGLPGLEKCLGNLQLQVRELDTSLNEIAVHKEPSFIAYHLQQTTPFFFPFFLFLSFPIYPLIQYYFRLFIPTFLLSSTPCPVLLYLSSSYAFTLPQHPVLSSFFLFFRSSSSLPSLPLLPGIMLMSNNGSNSGRNSTRDRTGSSDPAGIDLLLAPFSRTSSIQTSEGSPRGLFIISFSLTILLLFVYLFIYLSIYCLHFSCIYSDL